jgi:hypothetical protein
MVARYDYSSPIIAASVSHNEDDPDICFLSGHSLCFAVPSMSEFIISPPWTLNASFTTLACHGNLICLPTNVSSFDFWYRGSPAEVFTHQLSEAWPIWSIAVMSRPIVTLERKNVFQINVDAIGEDHTIRCVARHTPNYISPY